MKNMRAVFNKRKKLSVKFYTKKEEKEKENVIYTKHQMIKPNSILKKTVCCDSLNL